MPGSAPWPPSIAFITSCVLRPITAVSNSRYMAPKSMAGSMTIQSNSPLRPGNEAVEADGDAVTQAPSGRRGGAELTLDAAGIGRHPHAFVWALCQARRWARVARAGIG